MTEDEKDSWLVRAAAAAITKGWAIGIALAQVLGASLLLVLNEKVPKEWLLRLFGCTSLLWFGLSVLGLVVLRKRERTIRGLKAAVARFSPEEHVARMRSDLTRKRMDGL